MIECKYYKSGFTLIEFMMVVAVLGIAVAVAIPSIKNSFVKSEVSSAQHDIVQSLKKAKQFAKTLNTNVTVTLVNNVITYSLPDGSNQLPDGTSMAEVILPSRVNVSTGNGNNSHSFNALGMVSSVDVITVTSAEDITVKKTITILNLFGQMQVD